MAEKTILDWEAADHIESLKSKTQEIDCPVYPDVAKAIIFNMRRAGEQNQLMKDMPAQTAKLVNGQRRKFKVGPVEMTGYGMNDVLRALAVIGIAYMIAQRHGLIP